MNAMSDPERTGYQIAADAARKDIWRLETRIAELEAALRKCSARFVMRFDAAGKLDAEHMALEFNVRQKIAAVALGK